jgi:hypothetical protein
MNPDAIKIPYRIRAIVAGRRAVVTHVHADSAESALEAFTAKYHERGTEIRIRDISEQVG